VEQFVAHHPPSTGRGRSFTTGAFEGHVLSAGTLRRPLQTSRALAENDRMKSLSGAARHPFRRPWRRRRRPDPLRRISEALRTSRADPFQAWRDSSDHDFESVFTAARDGQGWALSELYGALFPRILQYLGAVEPAEAEDVACDTWLDVVDGLERFQGDEAGLRALSFAIARRRLLDVRRRRSLGRTAPRDPAAAIEARTARSGDETVVSSLGTDPAIGLITSSLSPEEVDVVLFRVIGDLDVDAVAGIVGTRPSDVRLMQHRAVRRLASVLETEGVTR
jgi:RNA polymerase sigma-70 factor, ECF subfamily